MDILPDKDLPFDINMLDRLAEVAIRVGLNLQAGQDLIITGPVEALPLIRRISAEAYKNGAGVVSTILSDDELLEKFAREKYFMKKESEDLFIIVEEE